ncbi:unnamed protein product [Linum tenue]|uniref:DNA polymerase delta subunit 4 n=2 Tax=Linum tenue TaxID=586396 RepID=A0AAV0ICH0_9ROSI|nr:unnamed protein product [Linum tenue]
MMKSYYKQKKPNRSDAVGKPSKSIKKKSPAALITSPHGAPHLQGSDFLFPFLFAEDVEKTEQVLREFDMNMAYGPCIGMTRMARWQRAQRLGLDPPGDVKNLLDSGKTETKSLWDDRV